MEQRSLQFNLSSNLKGEKIIYLMSRDQRVEDNFALIYSQEYASSKKLELEVIFILRKKDNILKKHYKFMIDGLSKVSNILYEKNIHFYIFYSNEEFFNFLDNSSIDSIFTDFSPLKGPKSLYKKIIKLGYKFYIVDTHNIVPVFKASLKQEYAAYTIRPKILKLKDQFIIEPQKIEYHKYNKYVKNLSFDKIYKYIGISEYITEFKSGEDEAKIVLEEFLDRIDLYNKYRNDPTKNVLSNLSLYLHYGQIYSLRVILEIKKLRLENNAKSFIEEILIRKELSDNFCYYNSNYDSYKGLPTWGKQTLEKHSTDKREYIYSLKELESSSTHDPLWNAAQYEMVKKGKMHSYMRMYWAKKILEWSKDYKKAIKYAIYLNNKYEMDGRDPNGYTGILWSIGGLHDRSWVEREIFGKVRFMNYSGAKRKFDVDKYISDNI